MSEGQLPKKVVAFPKPAPAANERLDSWKEIAAYLRRGTRTVQRWEREEGLPIHRLHHDKLGSVYAFRAELDAWWFSRGAALTDDPAAPGEQAASVAVLPFADLSREKDQEYFCEGVAEEIINALSRIENIRVASRTSSFHFKGKGADVREIGRKLRVGTLLEGSVRKDQGRFRISVQLTGAEDGYQLWSAAYDREMTDIFSIQEEIARQVAQALRITLSPSESASLGKSSTRDIEAYDYYLRGRSFYYRYGPRDVEFAKQLFEHAIERDPRYAPAWAGLADCWSYLYLYGGRREAARERADEASIKAVELDPQAAQSHASRALALSLNERDEEAEVAFETAIRLDPNLFEARYFYARHSFVHGKQAKAISLYEEAIRIRPEDYQSPLLVAQSYDDLGRPEDARAARLRGIDLAEQHLRLNPDDARALYMAANGMAALGEKERSRKWAERALAVRPDDPMLLYNVGCIFALLGCVEEAISCLEKGAELGVAEKGWYEHDSNLDPLRGHPRFQALVAGLA
ncbi:MAG: tetratricopeptide repeat protein [Bryobacteraceae bacterium]